MKKYIILIIFATFSNRFFAQTNINLLEENIFTTQLLFNNKCIEDIDSTNGDYFKMKGLFGNTLTKKTEITETGTQIVYQENGIKFVFMENNDTNSIFSLKSIDINNNFPSVKLQNKSISVNSSINIINNAKKSKYKNENYILYKVDSSVDMTLIINYNISTNKIISINYSNQLDY